MRKIKEVLRLKFEVGLGLRAIARSCSIGLGTAHEYLQRAEAAKITWPLGPEWDDDRLEAELFGGPPRSRPTVLPMPDFAALHRQRQQHRHLTQQLLWEEYRQANPDGYQYSRFCELYRRWCRKQDVVLRHEHKAGEKLYQTVMTMRNKYVESAVGLSFWDDPPEGRNPYILPVSGESGARRTRFRDDSERCSGMIPNRIPG